MGTHSTSGKSRAPRVKYVYVSPGDADTPVSGSPAPSARRAAEISVGQRFRDVALALLGVAASVLLILGGRVADYALQWSPGGDKPTTVTAQTADLAPAAFARSIGTAQTVITAHAYAEDDAGWQCASQGNGHCGKGPVNAQ